MLRVIAGEYGSRRLQSLEGNDTRPTMEKTRAAVFSRIGPYFDSGRFLDLFAGSGSMGIEALSRGMKEAVFVEKSSRAARVIRENLKLLEIDNGEVCCMSYETYLKNAEEPFDIIFMDPPYKMDIYRSAVSLIKERNLLKDNGVIILESDRENTYEFDFPGMIIEKEATYGISRITYLRKENI